MTIKNFKFSIVVYFGSSYSIELLDGLFLDRENTDGITTISQINPIYVKRFPI
jgi:hypothetical protein